MEQVGKDELATTNKTSGASTSKRRVDIYFENVNRQTKLANLRIEDSIKERLAAQVDKIADLESGRDGAFKTIEGCLERLFVRAEFAYLEREDPDVGDAAETCLLIQSLETETLDVGTMERMKMADTLNLQALEQYKEREAPALRLSVVIGNTVLANYLLPCVSNHTLYAIKKMTDTSAADRGATLAAEPCTAVKKTRKRRMDEVLVEKIKRIRQCGVGKICGDHDENGLPYYKLIKVKLENPVFTETRKCMVCERPKLLKSFVDTGSQTNAKGEKIAYLYVKNICHACLKASYRNK